MQKLFILAFFSFIGIAHAEISEDVALEELEELSTEKMDAVLSQLEKLTREIEDQLVDVVEDKN